MVLIIPTRATIEWSELSMSVNHGVKRLSLILCDSAMLEVEANK